MRRTAGSLAGAFVLLLSGCGGSSPAAGSLGPNRARVGIDAPAGSALKAGLLGAAPSAGPAVSYRPTGRIVADSGFRPQSDGFSFENYGNNVAPANLGPQNVQDLFGSQVCQGGDGANCRLIPGARFWMEQVNASMANGHCLGFSVTALRFFSGNLSARTFGGPAPIRLGVQNNVALQSLIAEGFAYQDLAAVRNRAIGGSPGQVLSRLVDALRLGREQYTLAILKADGSGGHAMTPFAVEDRGHGQAAILVYDNNFPGIVRQVDVDTHADTWHYVGGVNPSDPTELYRGDASTKSMGLLPTSPGEGQQVCPFCQRLPGAPAAGQSVLDKLHYVEVAITAPAAEHPHLLFFDPQGRRTGYVNGRLINEIPGLQVIQNLSVRNWRSAPEPTYRLPLGHPNIRMAIDSSGLTRRMTTKLQVDGAGIVFSVLNLHLAPGQQDAMLLPAGDLALAFVGGGAFPASPTIGAQFVQPVAGGPTGRLVSLATGSFGFAPGSPVTLAVRPSTGTAEVSSAGSKPLVARARFVLSADSTPVGGGPRERFYFGQLALNGSTAQAASFQYLLPSTPQLPVRIIGPAGDVGRVLLPSRK